MYNNEDAIIVHKYILDEIGISIEDSKLIDQDSKQQINFDGKPLVYSFYPDRPVFDTEDTIKLDMINNIKIANMMFGYYIEKEKSCGNIIDTMSFYQIDASDESGKSALGIKLDLGNGYHELVSHYFYINSLKYIDMILILANINYDLSILDDPTLSKIKQPIRRRNK